MGQETRRKRKTVRAVDSSDRRSILFTILPIGLVFCLANVGVILSRVDKTHQNGPSQMIQDTTINSSSITDMHRPPVKENKLRLELPVKETKVRGRENNGNPSEDKEPILRILKEAGFDDIDEATMRDLPTWTEVTKLYGDRPRIYGLDQCEAFRNRPNPAEHFLGVAGNFNSGTNLMSELLIANCEMTTRIKKYGSENKGIRWQVPWGKHIPPLDEDFRQTHKTKKGDLKIEADNVLPAVMIRDPYVWMHSMCRHRYEAWWAFSKEEGAHCPNLVPDQRDIDEFPYLKHKESIPVTVSYSEFQRKHASLAHFWNDWYNEYMEVTFPRLIVRFEDLIFFAKEVTTTVCKCAGGDMKEQDFVYIVDSAKKGVGAHGAGAHGAQSQRTSFIDAIVQYGKDTGRLAGLTPADIKFARKSLDRNLIKSFGYLDPPEDTQAKIMRNSGMNMD